MAYYTIGLSVLSSNRKEISQSREETPSPPRDAAIFNPKDSGSTEYRDGNRDFANYSFAGSANLGVFARKSSKFDFRCTKARCKNLAGAAALRMLSLLENRPIGEGDIVREAQGRPFLPGRALDFNIAHSGALAALSLVRGENMRTACDIERIRKRARAAEVAEDFFSADERNYLYPRGEFDETRFYEIWTLKECFLKLRGLSVFDMAASPSFVGGGEGRLAFDAPVSLPVTFRLYELSGGPDERYVLASAIEGAVQTEPEMRWFSQSVFGCKMTAEIKAATLLQRPL